MAKKWCLPLLILLLLFSMAFTCNAAAREYYYDGAWHTYEGNEFSLKVNGKTLKTSMPPIVFKDYSVVPAREVFEHLGAKVDWDGKNATVTVSYDKTEIFLRINSTIAKINGKTVTMPIEPKIINEKTMIPVRFVAEEIGLLVGFDSETDTVLIDTEEVKDTMGDNIKEETEEKVKIKEIKSRISTAKKRATITIKTDKSDAEYSVFEMSEPDRIVADIKNSQNKAGIDSIKIDEYNIEKIRIGQQVDYTRIVIDMVEMSEYDVEVDGSDIIITIALTKPQATAKPGLVPVDPNADSHINPTESPEPAETDVPSDEPTSKPSDKPQETTDPSASPTPEPTPPPINRYVTIDAGHGGNDPGTIYTNEEGEITSKEKDINLAVALLVKEKLEKNDVKVHMIRTTDKYVDFEKVGKIANEKGTSLFVSIHTNSAPAPEAHGIEARGYLTGGADYAGMTSKKLSENVLEGMIEETGANDRGVKDGKGLAVINSSEMPATLVELGFITNDKERENMMDDEYREKLAEGIVKGILKSLEEMGL